jgi:hypothetical protein
MYAGKITTSMLALVFGLAFAGLAGAADSAQTAPDAAKACCAHKDRAGGAAHCNHAAKDKSSDGKACCAKHTADRQEGAQGESCCCCDACEHDGKKAAPPKS